MATANPFVTKTSRKFATSPDILVAKGKKISRKCNYKTLWEKEESSGKVLLR